MVINNMFKFKFVKKIIVFIITTVYQSAQPD